LYELPLFAKQCQPQELLTFLVRDKKSMAGKINWVLLNSIGHVSISNQVSEDIVNQVLKEICADK